MRLGLLAGESLAWQETYLGEVMPPAKSTRPHIEAHVTGFLL
jgi:hypothetical protein